MCRLRNIALESVTDGQTDRRTDRRYASQATQKVVKRKHCQWHNRKKHFHEGLNRNGNMTYIGNGRFKRSYLESRWTFRVYRELNWHFASSSSTFPWYWGVRTAKKSRRWHITRGHIRCKAQTSFSYPILLSKWSRYVLVGNKRYIKSMYVIYK